MTALKIFRFTSFGLIVLLLISCTRFVGQNGAGGPPSFRNTAQPTFTTPAITPTPPPATAAPAVSRTPVATLDFISLLVTQAYQNVTITPHVTEATATATQRPVGIAGPTATAVPPVAPAAVIVSEPIQITNAVVTADCKIRGVGDCTSAIQAGETLFFNWTFGVKGDQKFKWGQAAVLVTRNGETFQWKQSGNSLVRPPDPKKNEGWFLNVGQSAKFAGGLEKAQPGSYTARLMMCLLSMDECNAGAGWQAVGGEVINFVIVE